MDEDRLEERLRTDPADDDGHRAGMFLDRLAGDAVRRTRTGVRTRRRLPLGATLIGVAALASVLVVRFGAIVPGPSAAPSPSPERQVIDATAVQHALARWATANGVATGTATLIDASGESMSADVAGAFPERLPTVRIGEVSDMFVVSATVMLIDCARTTQAACPLPVPIDAIRLDDHVSRWLPGNSAGNRTIRQLLDGTSGLAALGPSIADIDARITADPGGDWSRTALLMRALAAPQRFPAGDRREPVDTEIALLEELIGRAARVSADEWINAATIDHVRLPATTIGAVEPGRLTPGRTIAGTQLPDLQPALVNALGASGGISSDSADLARFSAAAWGTALINDVVSVELVTDAADGHQAPMGASGACPCVGGERTLIVRTGHAVGWSALTAYDFQHRIAIAVVLATDVTEAQLDALLQAIVEAAHPA